MKSKKRQVDVGPCRERPLSESAAPRRGPTSMRTYEGSVVAHHRHRCCPPVWVRCRKKQRAARSPDTCLCSVDSCLCAASGAKSCPPSGCAPRGTCTSGLLHAGLLQPARWPREPGQRIHIFQAATGPAGERCSLPCTGGEARRAAVEAATAGGRAQCEKRTSSTCSPVQRPTAGTDHDGVARSGEHVGQQCGRGGASDRLSLCRRERDGRHHGPD